jgi:alkanesulfonate monooxygenase SsuD/methylene tetrahydromethanopterin reductase-like flavin-dependent oxidoreductase (luciferase family)
MRTAESPLADCPVAFSVFSVCDHHPGLGRDLGTFYREIIASAVLAAGLCLFGSVETVVDRLVSLHRMGACHVMVLQDFGALPHALVEDSMRLLVGEVAPRLGERIAAAAAA